MRDSPVAITQAMSSASGSRTMGEPIIAPIAFRLLFSQLLPRAYLISCAALRRIL